MGTLTNAARTYRVADALTELYRCVAHYPIDVRRSDVRLHYATAEIRDLEVLRCAPAMYPALLRELVEEALADLVSGVGRDLGESESWVRAFSTLDFADKSANLLSGHLFVAYLYIDVGGLDPMPVV